ncbi:MAG: tetratricopeptide repeat protein, partial [Planctomycetota bacterium]|jgi:tetratricopeptide (TPR) repeat protein
LFFIGTLFPVLGFFNVYPFRFSFVANHFQYLPSLGIIALFAAAFVSLLKRFRRRARAAGPAVAAGLLAALGLLTWRGSRMYDSAERLYRTTIERNSKCWIAHSNLASLFMRLTLADRDSEKFDYWLDEAEQHAEEALRLKPDLPQPHHVLGVVLTEKGNSEKAIYHCRRAVEIEPEYDEPRYNLCLLLARKGETDGAIMHLKKLLKPPVLLVYKLPNLHYELGNALSAKGKIEEAIQQYLQALRISPEYLEAINALGVASLASGKPDEAAGCFRRALEINPNYADACNSLARLLSTHPSSAGAEKAEAVGLAKRACRLASYKNAVFLDTLAAAHAAAGDFDEAKARAQEAIDLAEDLGQSQLAESIRRRLRLYEERKPYVQQVPPRRPAMP